MMPQRWLFVDASHLWGWLLTATGGAGFAAQVSPELKSWATEIMAAVGIIGGGLILLWGQFQKRRRDEWIQQQVAERQQYLEWSKVKAGSLQAQIDTLHLKLSEATAALDQVRSDLDESNHDRDEMHQQNSTLMHQSLEMAGRIEELTLRLSQIGCPMAPDGQALCAVNAAVRAVVAKTIK